MVMILKTYRINEQLMDYRNISEFWCDFTYIDNIEAMLHEYVCGYT